MAKIEYAVLNQDYLDLVSTDYLYGKKLQFWRIRTLTKGWHCLGHTVTLPDSDREIDRNPHLTIFREEDPDSATTPGIIKWNKNNNYFKVAELEHTIIWLPCSIEGYLTIGLIATKKGHTPNEINADVSYIKDTGNFVVQGKPRQLVYGNRNGDKKNFLDDVNGMTSFGQLMKLDAKIRGADFDEEKLFQLNTFLWINEMEGEKQDIPVGNFWLVYDHKSEKKGVGPNNPLHNYTVSRRNLKEWKS